MRGGGGGGGGVEGAEGGFRSMDVVRTVSVIPWHDKLYFSRTIYKHHAQERYIPSLIRLMVSVDVKHHVYLLTIHKYHTQK